MRNLILLSALFLTSILFAQRPNTKDHSPAEKTQKFLKHWGKELNLTEDQKTRSNPGILNMFTTMASLRADSTMERKAKGRAMMNARKTGLEGFRSILTADQALIYDKKVQEMKDKQKSKKKNNGQGKGKGNGQGGNKGMKKAAEEEIENEDIF